MKIILLFIMIFCHIVDDYYLQGILANMKQKKWWQEHTTNALYQHDYVVALLAHSFSWSFMIMLPLLVYNIICNYEYTVFYYFYVGAIISNTEIHMYVDNLKEKKIKINLIVDQSIHIAQIIITYILFTIL